MNSITVLFASILVIFVFTVFPGSAQTSNATVLLNNSTEPLSNTSTVASNVVTTTNGSGLTCYHGYGAAIPTSTLSGCTWCRKEVFYVNYATTTERLCVIGIPVCTSFNGVILGNGEMVGCCSTNLCNDAQHSTIRPSSVGVMIVASILACLRL
jgi:hypothetical protein